MTTKLGARASIICTSLLFCFPAFAQQPGQAAPQGAPASSSPSSPQDKVVRLSPTKAVSAPGNPAQQIRDAKSLLVRPPARVHKFWDRENLLLQSLAGASAAADLWSTRRAISRGAVEANPFAQPISRSNAGLAALKMAGWGANLALCHLAHRKGWHKLERIIPVVSIAANGAAAAHNFRIR